LGARGRVFETHYPNMTRQECLSWLVYPDYKNPN
jgi:hypothetical protein